MKTILELEYKGINWGVSLEGSLRDFLVGVAWENREKDIDVYICLIPGIAIHYWSGRAKK